MSRNRVPLTTRPASTSMQGMTRWKCTSGVERGLALGDREAAFVERLARDHAAQVDLTQAREAPQVVRRPDPARVQEAATDGLGDVADLVEVGSLEQPVAVDVRVDEGAHAARAEAADRVPGGHPG